MIQLEDIKGHIDKSLVEKINHALELPLHHRMCRLEARWYIDVYSKNKEANQSLLELAVLNFNMVQSTLQSDLKTVARWDANAVKSFPYYMKLCFLALYNTVNEMAYDTLKDKGINVIPILSKADELQRGETANSILCCMHQNGLSEKLAREHISNLINEAWKKLNKGRVDDSPFSKHYLETAMNLARISQFTYQYGDGHGAPDRRS
ncbi:unnamed protein product [Ilex paraguariensis]|uniref:Terpene synthase metal-binding domain-containing protein n=1 Tax=Ilex paraguariensis TaxID=185542 RepID=A0ABC8UB95_9AQUA